jgi:hypothetical protein
LMAQRHAWLTDSYCLTVVRQLAPEAVYDNRPAGDFDLDLATPQPLDAGSIIVHD